MENIENIKGNEGTKEGGGLRGRERKEVPKVLHATRFPPKGQMFLIGAIFIIIGLVLLRNLTGIFTTFQEEEAGESIVADMELRNIKSEYNYIVGIATQQSAPNVSAINNLYNISDLIRNNKDAKILYMLAFANGTNQRYAVTIGNFLNDKINATVNVTGSSALGSYFGSVDDKTNVTAEFSPDSNATITITLNYALQNNNFTEIIKADVTTRNHFSLFYDITLEDSKATVRTKDVYNTTW